MGSAIEAILGRPLTETERQHEQIVHEHIAMREALESIKAAWSQDDETKRLEAVACCLATLDAIEDGETEQLQRACAEIAEIFEGGAHAW